MSRFFSSISMDDKFIFNTNHEILPSLVEMFGHLRLVQLNNQIKVLIFLEPKNQR